MSWASVCIKLNEHSFNPVGGDFLQLHFAQLVAEGLLEITKPYNRYHEGFATLHLERENEVWLKDPIQLYAPEFWKDPVRLLSLTWLQLVETLTGINTFSGTEVSLGVLYEAHAVAFKDYGRPANLRLMMPTSEAPVTRYGRIACGGLPV